MTFPPFSDGWPPTPKISAFALQITIVWGKGHLMKNRSSLSGDPTRSRKVKIAPPIFIFPSFTMPRKTQFPLISSPRKSLWMGQPCLIIRSGAYTVCLFWLGTLWWIWYVSRLMLDEKWEEKIEKIFEMDGLLSMGHMRNLNLMAGDLPHGSCFYCELFCSAMGVFFKILFSNVLRINMLLKNPFRLFYISTRPVFTDQFE